MNPFCRAALTIAMVAVSALRFPLVDLQAAPVAYSGKLAINGFAHEGDGHFRFQLVDLNGSVLWQNAADGSAVTTAVNRGHYSVLLGDDSTPNMSAIPPNLFLDHPVVFLRVHFSEGQGKPFQHLQPDQRILSSAHALTADVAEQARLAFVAEKVQAGAITLDMLSPEVLADFNQTIVITRDMLPPDVLADLNASGATNGQTGPITREMLPADVLADLNKTIIITREMLPADVLSDLNATQITPGMVTRDMLAPGVLADLNASIANGSITLDMLSPAIRADLNRTIVITREMLPGDVLADLNRTVTGTDMAANTITTAQLNEQILKYLKPEITASPQAPGLVFTGESVTLTGAAEGKYLTYQWNRNGQPIAGATGATMVITDANGTLHDGNYTLTATNDFGSATTAHTTIEVNATAANYVVPSIGMDMIWCHPGTYTMGSPSNEANRGSDETQTQVTLTQGFYLGKYEVTQAQWNAVMGTSPSQFTGNDRPVEKVSWTEAKGFCEQLTIMEQNAGRLPAGWAYVLPTEAQWEYACRAGTSTIFSWGDTATSTQANFKGTVPYGGAATGPNLQQTADVGSYGANPWGFFDMHGNVWEWCSDWKANYPNGPLTDPTGPASGSNRVRRGGSWNLDGHNLRSAKRNFNSPGYRHLNLGFRAGFRFTGQ